MVEIKHHKHAIGQIAFHFVWRPKYNISVFSVKEKREYMTRVLKVLAEEWNIQIYEMEIMKNHIHLFVGIPPTCSVSFAFNVLKGNSAKLFFRRFPEWRRYFMKGHKRAHLWSPGKFFRSIGSVTAETVARYIRQSNNWEFE